MTDTKNHLSEFRNRLSDLMLTPHLRPFLCSGSPLKCEMFIVGFNPATSLDGSFWRYWDDISGFDKPTMMRDYLRTRGLIEPIGVRARIERIVAHLPLGSCLETNICSIPTKKADQLHRTQRATEIFEFLLRSVKPKLVYAHSNEPIKFFQQFTDKDFFNGTPQTVQWEGREFLLLATPGPLYRMGFHEASTLGRTRRVRLEFQRAGVRSSMGRCCSRFEIDRAWQPRAGPARR